MKNYSATVICGESIRNKSWRAWLFLEWWVASFPACLSLWVTCPAMWTARSTARVVTTSSHSKTPFLLYLIHFIYVITIWHLPCRAITSTLPCHSISYKNSSLTTHYCRIIVDESVHYTAHCCTYSTIVPPLYSHSRCTRLRWLSVDDVTMTCHRYATCSFSMLRVSASNCSHVNCTAF